MPESFLSLPLELYQNLYIEFHTYKVPAISMSDEGDLDNVPAHGSARASSPIVKPSKEDEEVADKLMKVALGTYGGDSPNKDSPELRSQPEPVSSPDRQSRAENMRVESPVFNELTKSSRAEPIRSDSPRHMDVREPNERTITFNDSTNKSEFYYDEIKRFPSGPKKPINKKNASIRSSYESTRSMINLRRSKDNKLSEKSSLNMTMSDEEFVSLPSDDYVARPSRVSKILQSKEMDSKAFHGNSDDDTLCRGSRSECETYDPKKYFHSMTEEVLFKSMKRIRPKSATINARSDASVGSMQNSVMSVKTYGTKSSSSVHSLSRSMSINHSQLLNNITSNHKTTPKNPKARSSKFASFDEMKNCTFQPRLRNKRSEAASKAAADSDEEQSKAKEAASSGAFIDRQVMDERRRVAQREHKKGQAEYEAQVDKKYCPQCGGKRSYDEYKEKKKNCGVCNIPYANKIVWNNKMMHRFFDRDKMFADKMQAKQKELQKSLELKLRTYETQRFDDETGHMETVRENQFESNLQWDAETEAEFLERLETANKKKEERFNKIVQEMTYSFQPTISSIKKKKTEDEDEEDMDDDDRKKKDAASAFMERLENDMESYRKKHPPARKIKGQKTVDEKPRFK